MPNAPKTVLVLGRAGRAWRHCLDQLRAAGTLVSHVDEADQAARWLATCRPDLLLILLPVAAEAQAFTERHVPPGVPLLCGEPDADHPSEWLAPHLPELQAPQSHPGFLLIDDHTATVHVQAPQSHRSTRMPERERRVLACLLRHQGRSVSREALRAEAWPAEKQPQARSVDQTVSRLRRLLARLGLQHALHGLRGVGYRLDHPLHPPPNLESPPLDTAPAVTFPSSGLPTVPVTPTHSSP